MSILGSHGRPPRKKISALIISVLFVAAALIYIVGGGDIQRFLDERFGLGDIFGTVGDTAEGELQVHIIDVGQGDSSLIISDDGVILIDAGPNSAEDALRAHLDACGVKTIDYFICTHPHEDHIGGADMVINEYTVKTVLMPETDVSTATVNRLFDALEASDDTVLEAPEVGDEYSLGKISFKILAPDPSVADDANNSSIVLRLRFGDTYFMFTGDAEKASEEKILETFTASELKCDFLKIGHHGSSTSTSEEFLDAVSPVCVSISCEKGNSYGHPHSETLKKLEERGLTGERLLRTDELGTIVVFSDGKKLSVGSFRS